MKHKITDKIDSEALEDIIYKITSQIEWIVKTDKKRHEVENALLELIDIFNLKMSRTYQEVFEIVDVKINETKKKTFIPFYFEKVKKEIFYMMVRGEKNNVVNNFNKNKGE